jgi:hypothetical protein
VGQIVEAPFAPADRRRPLVGLWFFAAIFVALGIACLVIPELAPSEPLFVVGLCFAGAAGLIGLNLLLAFRSSQSLYWVLWVFATVLILIEVWANLDYGSPWQASPANTVLAGAVSAVWVGYGFYFRRIDRRGPVGTTVVWP